MTPEEIYKVWAPESSIWSPWATPVLFARLTCGSVTDRPGEMPQVNLDWLGGFECESTVVVVDLPGRQSVEMGIALTRRGYWPVPLYNGVPGTGESANLSIVVANASGVTVDMTGLMNAVCEGTGILKGLSLPPHAPPAFLLDTDRVLGNRVMAEGVFDNRWMIFPQNFPSAKFLLSRGIRHALLISRWPDPRKDLAHVLLRWQEAGIKTYAKNVADDQQASEIRVAPPSGFRRAWYRALAIAGFHRNSTGGFGGIIPFTTGG